MYRLTVNLNMRKEDKIFKVLLDCYAHSTAMKVVNHKDFKVGEDVELKVLNSEFDYNFFIVICWRREVLNFLALLGEKLSELTDCKYKGTGASCLWGSEEFKIEAELIKEEKVA